MNTVTAVDRLEGYKNALAEAKIPYDGTLVANGHYSRAESAKSAAKLLAIDPRPTAIYASNDIMAIGVMDVIKEKNLRVPEDCSVIGSDNIDLAQFTSPALTSVNMPIYEISRAAVRLLFEVIGGKSINGNGRQVMDTHLVARNSCSHPPLPSGE